MKRLFILLLCVQYIGPLCAQPVTANLQQVPAEKAFAVIQQQTGYEFLYNNELVQKAGRINFSVKQASLETALQQCFSQIPFTWKMVDKTIIITPQPVATAAAEYTINGKVLSADSRKPLAGATIRVKGTDKGATSNASGAFSITTAMQHPLLQVSFLGYISKEVRADDDLVIYLEEDKQKLSEVVVTTGYVTLPKERATGSFSQVDKSQLDKRITTNIIDKLEGLSTGLAFSRSVTSDKPKLSLRGRSTLFSEDQPLIVVNGFPIEGDLNTIDPDDVESITILKDAAAASIWGVRAANGVIVITTRQGKFNQRPTVELRSNFVFGSKPDYSQLHLMSTSDYIDAQQILFKAGRYNTMFSPSSRQPIPEAVQIWKDEKDGKITSDVATQRINALRGIDILNDYSRLFTRNTLTQQYQLNVSGGSENMQYYVSAGYDKNANYMVGNNYERFTLNTSNTVRVTKKMELSIAGQLTQGNTSNPFDVTGSSPFDIISGSRSAQMVSSQIPSPYTRLVDDNGNALTVPWFYNDAFKQQGYKRGFVNMDYAPLTEFQLMNRQLKSMAVNVRLGVNYELAKGLNLDLKYNLEKNNGSDRNLQNQNSFMVRDNVNLFSETMPDGELVRHLPLGDILTLAKNDLTAQTFRGQLNFNRNWQGKHMIAAIAGAESREILREGNTQRLFGYNDRTLQFADVDMVTQFPDYYGFTNSIGSMLGVGIPVSYVKDRFISYFSNASYTYLNRYTLSASGRVDGSNLFGVQRNRRLNPLWSVGAAWQVQRESFFHATWVDMLKLRATYGFNGNINKTATAYTTANLMPSGENATSFIPYGNIINPANPNLRWEKVGQINLGADFALFQERLNGSIEYFNKRAQDLFGNAFLAPSTGFNSISSNIAAMRTNGWELKLDSRNLSTADFRWNTTFMLSVAKDKVTKFYNSGSALNPGMFLLFGGRDDDDRANYLPVEGYPLFGIWAYPWGGLDAKGNANIIGPDGKLISDRFEAGRIYDNIYKMKYMGAVNPPVFGSLANTFSYKQLSLTVNVLYKFGHYFRRSDLGYYTLFAAYQRGPDSFKDRWKQAGDEKKTDIPAFTGVRNQDRVNNDFYQYSDVNVEKADHVRLQDVLLSYDITKQSFHSLPVSRITLYAQASNLGIIWRANKYGLDPDYAPQTFSSVMPPVRTLAIGAKVGF
ncbi:SusC/RagA family TonB-linked outer membrane protein [Chitinophaga arvensicola]|uniref:TonB-linked outer membrane protein, SusC/RagA family n=1 Tax=Chitinophaga arvensicola TaxID=29529 RepID=A0A1I0PSW8_9BACT|nr:SusC/RagA family TonB-linked outer membrane protein [Chitinophaga arvensicola]SEW17466.1 TonB-linked outer membrane protein, SusC/RagA family [Chitinophaga arvensicola]